MQINQFISTEDLQQNIQSGNLAATATGIIGYKSKSGAKTFLLSNDEIRNDITKQMIEDFMDNHPISNMEKLIEDISKISHTKRHLYSSFVTENKNVLYTEKNLIKINIDEFADVEEDKEDWDERVIGYVANWTNLINNTNDTSTDIVKNMFIPNLNKEQPYEVLNKQQTSQLIKLNNKGELQYLVADHEDPNEMKLKEIFGVEAYGILRINDKWKLFDRDNDVILGIGGDEINLTNRDIIGFSNKLNKLMKFSIDNEIIVDRLKIKSFNGIKPINLVEKQDLKAVQEELIQNIAKAETSLNHNIHLIKQQAEANTLNIKIIGDKLDNACDVIDALAVSLIEYVKRSDFKEFQSNISLYQNDISNKLQYIDSSINTFDTAIKKQSNSIKQIEKQFNNALHNQEKNVDKSIEECRKEFVRVIGEQDKKRQKQLVEESKNNKKAEKLIRKELLEQISKVEDNVTSYKSTFFSILNDNKKKAKEQEQTIEEEFNLVKSMISFKDALDLNALKQIKQIDDKLHIERGIIVDDNDDPLDNQLINKRQATEIATKLAYSLGGGVSYMDGGGGGAWGSIRGDIKNQQDLMKLLKSIKSLESQQIEVGVQEIVDGGFILDPCPADYNDVTLMVAGGTIQKYLIDYNVIKVDEKWKVVWDGYKLGDYIEEGDILRVFYPTNVI